MRETQQEAVIESRLETIETFSAVKKPDWVTEEAKTIHETHSQLRKSILANKTKWKHFDYCQRFANHYYSIALLYNSFYQKNKNNLNIIRICLEKCLSKLNGIRSTEREIETTNDLFTKATALQIEIDKIYINLENKLNEINSTDKGQYAQAEILINLGHVDYENCNFCTPELSSLKTDVLGMLLINLVSDIEEILSLDVEKDHYSKSNICLSLARVYQICGLQNLYDEYDKRASNEIALAFQELDDEDTTQKFREMVRKLIKEEKKGLVDVYKDIKQEFGTELSNLDSNYIERKFIQYCMQGVSEELNKALDDYSNKTDNKVIQNLSNMMMRVETLSDIEKIFPHSSFLILLREHQAMLKPKQLKLIVRDFKTKIWTNMSSKMTTEQQELNVLKELIIFLRSVVNNIRPLILQLQLPEFCTKTVSVQTFLSNILNLNEPDSKELVNLKSVTDTIKEKTSLIFMDKFVESLQNYGVFPELVIKGEIMCIRGKLIILSEIIAKVLYRKTDAIKEFRIVGADVVCIDDNLENQHWAGINVMVVANTVHVKGKHVWNLSGRNAVKFPSRADNGAKLGYDGRNGKNGLAGQCGGNVYISCTNMTNSSNLTIISNGGNGGMGQTGGNGAEGHAGNGIKLSAFENLLSPLEPSYDITTQILRTAASICSPGIFNIVDQTKIPNFPLPKIASSINEYVIKWSATKLRLNVWNTGPAYITGKTKNGCTITYSYYPGAIPSTQEVFALYEGTLAEIGGHAGIGGLGGPGGFPGDVEIKRGHFTEVIIERKLGECGQKGPHGQTGLPGKNGWDMGLVFVNDFFSSSIRKIIGSNQDSKISLEFHNGRDQYEFVFCPYRKYYCGLYSYYVQVKTRNSNTNISERRARDQKVDEQQEQIKSTRSKAISRSVISQEEENIRRDMIDEIVNLNREFESLKEQALEVIVDTNEEKEIEMTNLQVQRQAVFDDSALQNERKRIKKRQKYEKLDIRNEHVDKVIKNHSDINLWKDLKAVVIDLPDLTNLFSLLLSKKPPLGNNFTMIYNNLLNKYKIAICQQIDKTKKLPEVEVYFNPEPIERYLMIGSNGKEYTHYGLGILKEYFHPGYEKLLPRLQNYLKHVDVGLILYPLKFFIIEKSYNNQNFEKESRELLEKLNKLETKLEILIKCYIVAHEKDDNSSIKIAIESHKNKIINQFKKETDYEFIRSEFFNYIKNIGMSSTAVRELLSCAFDVNIKIFIINQNNDLILYHNHSPSSKNILNLFLVNGQFVEFCVDEQYVNLITERKKRSKNYSDILCFVNEFICKKQIDDFFDNFDKFNGIETSDNKYLTFRKLSDDDIIKKICAFFPPTERLTIMPVLNKLKSKIIQNNNILKSLLQRFDVEGIHIMTYEMLFITSTILRSFIDNSTNLEIYEWILSVKSQTTWLNEIYYLQLENHFKKSLKSTSIGRYLTMVKQKDIILLMDTKLKETTDKISLECISACLEVLSEIEVDEETIRSLPLSKWQYTLREQLLEYRLCCITHWESNDQLQKGLYYLNCLETNIGSDLINKLLGIFDVRKDEITAQLCIDILSLLHLQEWSLDENLLNKITTHGIASVKMELEKIQQNMDEDRSLETLLKLIESNSNTSDKIKQALKSYGKHPFLLYKNITTPHSQGEIKEWSLKFKEDIKGLKNENKKHFIEQHTNEVLEMLLHAIKLRKGFMLRTTQKLGILLMLSHNHSTLSQIGTGEGKSLIVVVVSIFKALCGEKVDVITSSSVLAIRDATIHEDIYKIFNIPVSHNCSEKLDERRDAYSACPVIFGDLTNFQRDYLLDRFYGKNILGDRTFDSLIVDEVDSMLLDKGNNTLYLSHEIPGLDKLESVYQFLWKRICMSAGRKIENFEENLKREVLFDLYGIMSIEDIMSSLDISLTDANVIYNYLKDIKVIDHKHRVLKEISDADASKLSKKYQSQIHKIRYIINKILKRNIEIHIPKCLYKFVELHMDEWIKNGLLAIIMEEGIDYVVDVDRTHTKADISPNITIIDKGTGTDQSNSQWEAALHQFLQLKHGCKVSPQSLKAVFISNVSYFKKYRKLFGLTGTLGSQVERDLLKELYEVQFVNVPTARPKKFIEHEPLLCCTNTDWQFRIISRTRELTKSNRSVLIICETIKEVNTLARAFKQAGLPDNSIYKREYEECSLAQGKEKLGGGSIIIATNLAGRGTDIKITDKLEKNGGLHVLLTYLPSNARIEQQAFGRAARGGSNGSGQLIIIGYGSFLNKREQREAQERQRIADIKIFFDTRIKIEEKFFDSFTEVYKNCNKSFLTESNLKTIASQRLLDRWAFWIDEYGSKLSDSTIDKSFNEFKNEINDNFSKWEKWQDDPIQIVKIGLNYIQQLSYEKAIKVFNTVIKLEPHFCEAAHYYKAAALIRPLDFEKRPFIGKDKDKYNEFLVELKKAERLFEAHKDVCMESSGFIQNLKQNMENSFMTVDAFRTQQESMITLYDFYLRSINDIVGHQVTKGAFVSQEIKQDVSEEIYKKFLEKSILNQSYIAKANAEDIEELSSSFGIPVETLTRFLESYEGISIDEQEFLKVLKSKIRMPSLEECWKVLQDDKKLINEIKFVVIEKSKLTTIQHTILDNVEEQAEVNFKSNKGKYVFMKQYINTEKEEPFIFEEKHLKKAIGSDIQKILETESLKKFDIETRKSIRSDLYKTFEKENVLIFNRMAEVSQENTSKPISLYDYITINNLTSDKIIQADAQNILNTLTESGFLKKNSDSYNLSNKYDESKLPRIPAYDQALTQILRINFSYRIALQNLQNDLQNTDGQVYVKMVSEPHVSLMWEIIGKKIIQSVSVNNHESEDIGKPLRTYGKNDTERDSITDYVKGVLQKLAGSLKSLEAPSFKLVYIIEYMDDQPVSQLQELNTFTTNGLDFILKSEEKKYTWKMIWSTIFVTVLGLLEVAAGLAIQLFFAGTLSHVGNWLINEGLSDLQYAASCWWTGTFDWGDYGRHKLQSMIQSLAVCFISAGFSYGLRYSRFGSKLALSGVRTAGKEVTKISGRKLFNEVGYKAVSKKIGEQFIVKVGEGLAKGLVNESINSLIDSYLQNLCNQLANIFVVNVENAVNDHKIKLILPECYRFLGHKQTKERIDYLTKKNLSYSSVNYTLLSKAKQLSTIISSVCSEAAKRGNEMPYAKYIKFVAKNFKYVLYVSHLIDMGLSISRLLSDVNEQLMKDVKEAQKRGIKEKKYDEQEIKNFKNDTISKWRKMLTENANKIFTNKIAKPVLQKLAFDMAVNGNDSAKKIRNFARNKYHKHIFDTTKQKIETKLQDQSLTEQTRNQAIDTYHEALSELKSEIRDPKLYAEIVMEKGYMDAVCLKATSNILDKVRGDDPRPIKLTVETDTGNIVEYSTPGTGETRQINLKLEGKHFTNTNEDIAPNTTDYECLYLSLVHECPKLSEMSMDQFRSAISKEIKTNDKIKKDIEQGKHAFTIRKNIYGGHTAVAIATDSLRKNLMKGNYFFSQSSVSEKTAARGNQPSIHLSELANSIKGSFDETKGINVVEQDGKYIFSDNRRVVAASSINNPDVKILVRVFKYDEVLPPDMQRQYRAKVAGDAAETRNMGEANITTEQTYEFYRRPRDIGYNRYKRTHSTDRQWRN